MSDTYYTWKVAVVLLDAEILEELLNRFELDGWDVFAVVPTQDDHAQVVMRRERRLPYQALPPGCTKASHTWLGDGHGNFSERCICGLKTYEPEAP